MFVNLLAFRFDATFIFPHTSSLRQLSVNYGATFSSWRQNGGSCDKTPVSLLKIESIFRKRSVEYSSSNQCKHNNFKKILNSAPKNQTEKTKTTAMTNKN